MVPKKHFRSNKNDCFCTYSPSSFAFTGISSSSLPLICAHPVNPGFTSFAPYFSLSAVSRSWFHNPGLGPMILIFSTKISQICGNSSKLCARINLPTLVMYWSGLSNWCVGTSWGVDTFMLLNLCNLGIATLFFPNRFWVKSTGPGSSILIASAIAAYTGDRTSNPPNERPTSNALLAYLLYNDSFVKATPDSSKCPLTPSAFSASLSFFTKTTFLPSNGFCSAGSFLYV